MAEEEKVRCGWATTNPLMIAYHDEEWGIPVHDDRKWFEYILLDAFQAGLSWNTIINKRENFRKAFDNFEPAIIAGYGEEKIAELLADPGIVRNKLKVYAAINNAKQFLKLQKKYGSFDKFIWSFTDGETVHNHWQSYGEAPARTEVSDAMSKALIKEGFKFAGSTICYAFMQAAGMVNDHTVQCFRYQPIQEGRY